VARVPGKYALVRIYPVGRQFVSYYLSNILLWTVKPTDRRRMRCPSRDTTKSNVASSASRINPRKRRCSLEYFSVHS
jgi:hypothetical protein